MSQATQTIVNNKNLVETIKNFEKENIKTIIRPSGTEPVLRLFVEHTNKETATNALKKLDEIIADIFSNESS